MAILERILWGGLSGGRVWEGGAAAGHCRRQCIEARSADQVNRGEKISPSLFSYIAGLALVAPMCFALHCLLVSSQAPEYRLDSKPGSRLIDHAHSDRAHGSDLKR